MAPTYTQQLGRAAGRNSAARTNLHTTIRAARGAGLSLRTIAAATGLSVEQVRRITLGLAR